MEVAKKWSFFSLKSGSFCLNSGCKVGLFKRLVDAFLLQVVKSTFIFSELFAGSPGKGMC